MDRCIIGTLNETMKKKEKFLFKLLSVVSFLIMWMRLHYIGWHWESKEYSHYCDYVVKSGFQCVRWRPAAERKNTMALMVIKSHINNNIDRFHFSALQLACITLCILPYLNRCSYEIYDVLEWYWYLCILFRHTDWRFRPIRLKKKEWICVTKLVI